MACGSYPDREEWFKGVAAGSRVLLAASQPCMSAVVSDENAVEVTQPGGVSVGQRAR